MTKHLFIIRHAKSDWTFKVDDFDRPLNDRGFNDAPRMARRLQSYDIVPEHLISSPAKRALTTSQIFAETLKYPNRKIQVEPNIYEASTDELLEVINHIPTQFEAVALFGHNPGLSYVVSELTGQTLYNLPTCSIVHVAFENVKSWIEISRGSGMMINHFYPKETSF